MFANSIIFLFEIKIILEIPWEDLINEFFQRLFKTNTESIGKTHHVETHLSLFFLLSPVIIYIYVCVCVCVCNHLYPDAYFILIYLFRSLWTSAV